MVLIGTPIFTKNNHVEATFGVAPSSMIHGPFDISTYPSINCPIMSDIKSPALFFIIDNVAFPSY